MDDPTIFRPFSYLTAQNAGLYRRVMLAFVAAKRRFVVHLRSEDVVEAVPGEDPTAIAEALKQLVSWGNLRADPDTSRVTSVEDFHRARFLYQLTHAGETAERALAVFDEQLGRRGALQAVALRDIAVGLGALHALAREREPDVANVGLVLRDLVGRCGDLADNAQAFMGSLQRTIDLYEMEVDAFLAYKDRLIDYLERFIRDLTGTGAEIAELLNRIGDADVERLLTLVAARDSEDVAPGADESRDVTVIAELTVRREQWLGLRQWFISVPGHPSQAKLLRAGALKAIPDLLGVVTLLNQRRAGRSDRNADFRELAVWFAEAPDATAMHGLWQAAFGLHSARHLSLDAETARARDGDPIKPSTPWREAPRLMISPRLRQTGSYERRGKPNRVIDRRHARRVLSERAAAEAEQTAAARARLVSDRPVALSQLDALDADAFALFLTLLGQALSARRPGEPATRTATGDGSLEILLSPIAGAGPVEITTEQGIFRGPDHLLHIIDLSGRAEALVA